MPLRTPGAVAHAPLLCVCLAGLALLTPSTVIAREPCTKTSGAGMGMGTDMGLTCLELDRMTIFGSAASVDDVAGGASVVSNEDLQRFRPTDVQRALRQVPGVSLQIEDGFGLRPNISIRGTAAERSSRVTLMEDGVLIAPAPYTAPAAYYFPTFGRIHAVEVLKGPSSITQGPYTTGGAINLLTTPIPEQNSGMLLGEYGSFDTWRVHGWYGGGNENWGYLLETHQWRSDGFQDIDRSGSDTGLDKQDYMAKLRWNSDPGGSVYHVIDLKVDSAQERSRQSYLGLTDEDFRTDGLRRYGLSEFDEMDNEHQQLTASWRLELESGMAFTLTAYDNDFERAWYKTEGIDFDGSDNAQDFSRTSWANVIRAVNEGRAVGGLSADELQAILDGADTEPGAIQLRNNSREYYSRGVQLRWDHSVSTGATTHRLEAGLRVHRDEEDRLQRNDSYQQIDGQLVLSDRGLEGNAGNRIQDAEAWAVYLQDRIGWGAWTFTPGLRYESIDLTRTDYGTSGDDPADRDPSNITRVRSNAVDIWIPGLGLLFDFDNGLRLVAGVHRGFAVPGNQPGVDPEESVNWELGLRYANDWVQLDLMGFFNDYENLVGICSNSSGSDCEPGDAFNGDAVEVPGLEVSATAQPESGAWAFPLLLSYTWMNAEFQTDFDSEFFGPVSAGDPVPYIPDQQLLASAGVANGPFSAYLSANYVDSVCTQASCGLFERTESATLWDLAVHYRLNEAWELYAIAENLTDEIYIAGREPYGARPNKPQSFSLGVRFGF